MSTHIFIICCTSFIFILHCDSPPPPKERILQWGTNFCVISRKKKIRVITFLPSHIHKIHWGVKHLYILISLSWILESASAFVCVALFFHICDSPPRVSHFTNRCDVCDIETVLLPWFLWYIWHMLFCSCCH